MTSTTEAFDTIVIGGGQAGLAVGHALKARGLPFVILDAHERVGDAWRKRWDSLRLFSPARLDSLPGLPFPGPANAFPTKDQMADYLESYATRFELPVRSGVRVDSLARLGDRFVVSAATQCFEADNIVVAMSSWQKPRVPTFAGDLDPRIVQLHSSEYRHRAQLRDGTVLIVGAGNSGAEIGVEVARSHHTVMAGRDTGQVPFPINGLTVRLLVPLLFRIFFHRIATVRTPIGRKLHERFTRHGMPLIRTRQRDLAAAGVERAPRVVGIRTGLPLLEDGRVLEVANVIWCTGYQPGFSWIDLPEVADDRPLHERGIVAAQPGLYFVGLEFLYAASSAMIHGVGRDAERIARAVAARRRADDAATMDDARGLFRHRPPAVVTTARRGARVADLEAS
jgi:putative flavoprotein involved in K+ transport